ncbi:glycosyltransferase [Bradyrhizobium guangdongense]|uniref:glycosyltransferase n=1 Tax=Bradyrhizobium guangdongense TaxID=1325090 RepID=UPI001FDFB209|nr:glycosyltransferase family A protein [Bradyrhizobium guangdongense]
MAIGRNEGERLKRCLLSVRQVQMVVYVDSGSSDGSVAWAREQGIEVVELDLSIGFTAARARNAGLQRLQELAPDLSFVQFVDGDCELAEGWLNEASDFLDKHPEVAAVFGRLRERNPEGSIYNWLCDREWDVPIGEVKHCGGNAMMQLAAVMRVGGYREDLIAGEEPELCVRLRRLGSSVWRIDKEMGFHDAAMTRFRQWWLRRVRSGYAFAQGSHLHGGAPERHWVWESRRAWIWAIWLPVACAIAVVVFGLQGLVLLAAYPLQFLRRAAQQQGSWRERSQLAFFELLGRLPEGIGQLRFLLDRLLRTGTAIIEYK